MPSKPPLRRNPKTGRRTARHPKGERYFYSDNERQVAILAVRANGGNINKTAKQLGYPESTLRCWVEGSRHPEAVLLHAEKNGDLAQACEELAWKLAALIPSKIDEATLAGMSTAFGIMVDKMRILRGEPTTINANKNMNLNASVGDFLLKMTDNERDTFRGILESVTERGDSGPTSGRS